LFQRANNRRTRRESRRDLPHFYRTRGDDIAEIRRFEGECQEKPTCLPSTD
jgi:hypothetical protein